MAKLSKKSLKRTKYKMPPIYGDDPIIEKRKKTIAQEYRDAAGTGMALDAYDVDKEEGRLVKDSKGRNTSDTNPKTRKKRRGKTQAKMGGGKIYASQNKKYGGGVYPRPTKGEDI